MTQDNASQAVWFARAALGVSMLVARKGGAVIVTRDGLRAELTESDQLLRDCPESVWSHITCALKPRHGLESTSYLGEENSVLLIFNPSMFPSATDAKAYCESSGLSDDVTQAVEVLRGVAIG